jgi:hypothetical protein
MVMIYDAVISDWTLKDIIMVMQIDNITHTK